MTQQERATAIDKFLDGLSYVHMKGVEPYFSWTRCDTCNSSLGGNRHEYSAFIEEFDEWTEFEVCTDCTMELEYPGEEHA